MSPPVDPAYLVTRRVGADDDGIALHRSRLNQLRVREHAKRAYFWSSVSSAKKWLLALAAIVIACSIVLVTYFKLKNNSSTVVQASVNSPASFLALGNNWQLQAPVLNPTTNSILVISNPDFQNLSSPFFHLNPSQTGVVFYVNNTGITTPGSNSPRTELRQTTGDGTELAAWDANGSHALNVDLQVDHVPDGKFVIVSQLFATDEGPITTLRVKQMTVNSSATWQVVACFITTACKPLDSDYILGTRMTLKLIVLNGVLTGSYENSATRTSLSFSQSLPNYDDYSFKLGAYCSITTADPATEFCQVSVFSVSVS
ncbi:UNVERIFIED_CONTAM: hypothetical protein HDU68_000682 [Siphonaria sp. JEL0065]|nr:hypothetical protein HDU68_000682 [Siphonaria sp. JEL0065]